MSNVKTESEKTGTLKIYEQIRCYCYDRIEGIGGYYGQQPYKGDFFDVFVAAYTKGLCGIVAQNRYKKRCKQLKRKKVERSDYVISGESIHNYLNNSWLRDNMRNPENERMVDTLCDWWDAWLYAWDGHPGSLPREWRLTSGHMLNDKDFLVSNIVSSPNYGEK